MKRRSNERGSTFRRQVKIKDRGGIEKNNISHGGKLRKRRRGNGIQKLRVGSERTHGIYPIGADLTKIGQRGSIFLRDMAITASTGSLKRRKTRSRAGESAKSKARSNQFSRGRGRGMCTGKSRGRTTFS